MASVDLNELKPRPANSLMDSSQYNCERYRNLPFFCSVNFRVKIFGAT